MDGMIERYGTLFETFPSPIKIKKRRFLRENYDDDYLLKSATEAEGNEEPHSPVEDEEIPDDDLPEASDEFQEWILDWVNIWIVLIYKR